MSDSIKVVDTKTKGRALISSRRLIAGEIILKDSPILLYSAAALPLNHNYCSHCYRTISPTTTAIPNCPNCKTLFFCSPNCQTLALSSSHTPYVCQSLNRLNAADSPLIHHPHDRRLQARFLIAAYNLSIVSPDSFRVLLSLQGETLNDDETVNFLHSLISTLCPLGSFGEFGFSVQLTDALLAKDKLNAFGLMEPFDLSKERSVRAYGVYPKASFFNHDCLPNACRFDYVDSVLDSSSNADIVVRVIHDLPEGREICLSYFPVNFNYSERQQRLREDYGFTCDCDRCKVEANWSDDEGEGEGEGGMEQEDEDMDEDVADDDGMGEDLDTEVGGSMDKENDDFPHAYFFMRYMCNKDNCWGTLAPLPPADARPSTVMECNVCGNLSNSEYLMNGNGQLQ